MTRLLKEWLHGITIRMKCTCTHFTRLVLESLFHIPNYGERSLLIWLWSPKFPIIFSCYLGGFKSDFHEDLMGFNFVKVADQDKWKMSFVMPSKYGTDLPLPKDSSVTIKEVPRKIVAVVTFSGLSP